MASDNRTNHKQASKLNFTRTNLLTYGLGAILDLTFSVNISFQYYECVCVCVQFAVCLLAVLVLLVWNLVYMHGDGDGDGNGSSCSSLIVSLVYIRPHNAIVLGWRKF